MRTASRFTTLIFAMHAAAQALFFSFSPLRTGSRKHLWMRHSRWQTVGLRHHQGHRSNEAVMSVGRGEAEPSRSLEYSKYDVSWIAIAEAASAARPKVAAKCGATMS